ncbi:MAG TPA: universal stress protein [Bacteroidales bacterium]|nr:universal stress protein [Bacteroidales bacterium]
MKPKHMTKVLIAIDYNPSAQKVAEIGYSLAKNMGAATTLLHVIVDPVYYASEEYSPIMGFSGYPVMNPLMTDIVKDLFKASDNYLDKTRRHLGDTTIRTVVGEGRLSETILKTALEMHADIIVMGSHSQKRLENILMGSVTEDVLRKSTLPVLFVPTNK